jgi:hypothetical protein
MESDEQREKYEARSGNGPFEDGHLEEQPLYARRRLGGTQKSDVRAEGHPAYDGSGKTQMVEQRDDTVGVRVHTVCRRVPWFVRHAVPGKVEQHYPVAGTRQCGCDRSVEVAVEQEPVQVNEDLRTRTVHFV